MADDTAPAPDEPTADQQHAPESSARDVDEVDWKAMARKHEARAKANAAAAEELERIKASQKTEAELAAERMAQAEKRAAEAEAKALRREVALDAKLSRDDAELLDLVTDEDAIRRLAERLSTPARTTPLPDPTAGGGQGTKPQKSAADAFADFTSDV